MLHDVFIRDDLAFVSDIADPGGLVILDLTDPDIPSQSPPWRRRRERTVLGMSRITCTSTSNSWVGKHFCTLSI